jgi:galactokinase
MSPRPAAAEVSPVTADGAMIGPAAVRDAVDRFRNVYQTDPAMAASAPGRVNLIGEHLDYNGGPVLPVALDRRTAVAVSAGAGWTFTSTAHAETATVSSGLALTGEWTDYLVGVLQELRARGFTLPGARVAVASNVPIGAGLSSSAALTVAATAALGELAGRTIAPAELVAIAFAAEHDRVGVRCGRMDQTIAAHAREGHALFLETATGAFRHTPLPVPVWVLETGTSHRLAGGELNQRRQECESALAICRAVKPTLTHLAALTPPELPAVRALLEEPLFRRVRHVVTEVARTRAAAEALDAGDLPRLGSLLLEGHASLLRDYESTVGEADFLVDAAVRHGAYGARLTGAGWGGAVVMLAAPANAPSIVQKIQADFLRIYDRPLTAWPTLAGPGARTEHSDGWIPSGLELPGGRRPVPGT